MKKKYTLTSVQDEKDLNNYGITDENIQKGLIGKLDICFGNHGKDYFGLIKEVNGNIDGLQGIMNEFTNYYRYEAENCIFASLKNMQACMEECSPGGEEVNMVASSAKHRFYIRMTPNQTPDASVFCYYIPPKTAKSVKSMKRA